MKLPRPKPRWILLAGWFAFLLYAYPGYMTRNDLDQLVDSRTGEFTDWNPPMMTEVWRVIGRVVSGPAGMLALQSLLLLACSYHLLRRALTERAAAIAAVCVLVFPPVLATTALICPEAQLAAFLLAGYVTLSHARRAVRLVGLGLMVVACGVCDGAIVAALPLVLAAFRWDDRPARVRHLAIAAGASAAVVLVSLGLGYLFVDVRSQRPAVELAMADIIGTLDRAPATTDAGVQALLPGVRLAVATDLQDRARRLEGKVPRYAESADRLFDPPATEGETDALLAARSAVRSAFPGAYLRHRGRMLYRLLGFSPTDAWRPVQIDFIASAYREGIRHAARHSLVQRALIRPVRWLSGTFLFHPYVYFILALILLPLAAIRRQLDTSVLLASGILYELAQMFEAVRVEYRVSHWMIVACVLAIILLVARRARGRDDG